jgi:recombination protein RecR
LIKTLARLPGLGPRSAQRVALHLLTKPQAMATLQTLLQHVGDEIKKCSECGNISLSNPCFICTSDKRERSRICIVEGVDDIWALERAGVYKGLYHVLGGVVSALNGVTPEDITLGALVARVEAAAADGAAVEEVVLALPASVEGQTTGFLVAERLKHTGVAITTLARGMPMGADVDWLDEATLTFALNGRRPLTF